MAEVNNDECDLCGGSGEVEATVGNSTEYIPCPSCVSRDLHSEIEGMKQTQEHLAKALAIMVNTFGTSHKYLGENPTKFQIATQHARDALALSGNEELIADHLIQSGVWKE